MTSNARGIAYNGKVYVWSTWFKERPSIKEQRENQYLIQYRLFENGQLSGAHHLWGGKSEAKPAPVLVQYPNNGPQKMFVFVTGQNGNIYFTRLNGDTWEDGDWLRIRDAATGNYISTKEESWEVASVYDPTSHSIWVYYAKDYNNYLYAAVSGDFGDTWYDYGKVYNSPIVKSPPGAVPYQDAAGSRALVAVKDADQKIRVCHMYMQSVVSSEVVPTPASDNIAGYGRPFLTDVGNGYLALLYAAEHGDQAYCSNWYIPHICLFDKATGQWGAPYQATTLPDLGTAQGEFQFHWQPNGVMDPATNTFWLFYGFELCALYTDNTNDGPWWVFSSIPTPGPSVAQGADETAGTRGPPASRAVPAEPFFPS